jgi:mevalonate kinase
MNSLVTSAPGKLILSGEHAVVCGAPAIAIPTPKAAHCTLTHTTTDTPSLHIHLPQLDCHVSLNTFELAALKQVLRTYHHAFCEGKASLPIINGPTDLVAYTCALFFETHPLDNQLKLALTTDLPIGCGMGSSAAVVVSTLKALNALHDDALNTDELCVLAKAAEDLQHGRSSGIDVAVSLHGTPIVFEYGKITALPELPFDIQIHNTGTPTSTTGECVAHTQKVFAQHPELIAKFTMVTQAMHKAIEQKDITLFKQSIRANHLLLCEIGVVPDAIQHQIAEIEAQGGAAKISGAGSVVGKHAGVTLQIA